MSQEPLVTDFVKRSCMLMPPSRTREARQGTPGEKHGLQLAW